MNWDELRAVADKILLALEKWGAKGKIAITGGEPLIKQELFQLLDYLSDSSQVEHFEILSNGTLLDDEVASRIKQYNKFHSFQISLDGGSEEVHDRIRGEGAFKKALHAIRLLRKQHIPVRLMFTIHRGNSMDIDALIDLAIEEDVDAITIERFVPAGSGADLENLVLSSDEIKEIYKYISERADKEYKKGTKLKILKYRSLWILLHPERCVADLNTPVHIDHGAMCSIGIDSLCILPDATVLPCRRLNLPIGNLMEDSIFKIWYTSDLLWTLRNKNNLKGKCQSCNFIPRCGGCRATAYALTGDYLAEDPQCWV